MIAAGRDLNQLRNAPWTSVFPGVAIGLAVLGFNLIGDALRDALDPRHAERLAPAAGSADPRRPPVETPAVPHAPYAAEQPAATDKVRCAMTGVILERSAATIYRTPDRRRFYVSSPEQRAALAKQINKHHGG